MTLTTIVTSVYWTDHRPHATGEACVGRGQRTQGVRNSSDQAGRRVRVGTAQLGKHTYHQVRDEVQRLATARAGTCGEAWGEPGVGARGAPSARKHGQR